MEITKKEFMKYERLRESGKVNMFEVNKVSFLTGLSRKKIFFVMKNYCELGNKYLGGK